MSIALCIILFVFLAFHTYRQHWAKRELPQIHSGEFDGELMKVGATYIARRPAIKDSSRTIICFPGFLEDMRYFQDVYKDNAAELILVNNANYHCPFPDNGLTELEQPENPYKMGTIEHDGFYLGLVLERLATGTEVYLHGHSRGGAVVLETGRQYPELTLSKTRAVSALLEAAVLPQARTAGNGSKPLPHRIICYLLPIILGRSRHNTAEQLLKNPMMHPTNTLKTQMCLSMYSTSRSYNTCVANVQSIVRWQRATDFEGYKNYAALTPAVAENL